MKRQEMNDVHEDKDDDDEKDDKSRRLATDAKRHKFVLSSMYRERKPCQF